MIFRIFKNSLIKCSAVCFVVALFSTTLTVYAAGEENAASHGEPIKLPIEDGLQQELSKHYEVVKNQIANYKPRTEHLEADGSPHYVNRLIREDSPYLLQHAHNPVNWFSWGEEALIEARRTNKPIFLSVGYATCHWCHVMEREVFEDLEVAQYMNENYIAIKVDREQRPDVDETFMTAVQMMTGRGGWPLSAWLTTEAKPFYGGTYFPKESFMDLSVRVNSAWTESEDLLHEEAQKVATALHNINQLSSTSEAVGDLQVDESIELLLAGYDDLQGGFGEAPKFPRESSLLLLLERARSGANAQALEAAHFTLTRIAAGGIHDQIAGGFHRYAVDGDWQVPHFEKMLYNQAYLARAYLLSYELTGDWEHGRVAARTLDYVLREMTSSAGTFYSATDADSDGGEGKFFIWSPAEVDAALNADDATFAKRAWRISPEGNFEGKNILHHDENLVSLSKELDIPIAELTKRLKSVGDQLLQKRQDRIKPLRDEKIITGWNGMLITALAQAGSLLDRTDYIDAATTAAQSILDTQLDSDGKLSRIHFNGRQSVEATQADYAFFAEGLIALYDSTGERHWLKHAESLVAIMDELFLDKEGGGYFMAVVDESEARLPVRPKSLYDNAIPAGTSVAVRILSQLFHRTGKDDYFTKAEFVISSMAGIIERGPTNFAYLLIGVDELYNGENGADRVVARGNVSVSASLIKTSDELDTASVELTIDIEDGWHINANQPLQDYLIGTVVKTTAGDEIDSVDYPEALTRKLGFDRNELALYEGSVKLQMPFKQIIGAQAGAGESETAKLDGTAIVQFVVDLQACNDTTCLAPESITVDLSTASLTPQNSNIALAH